MTFQGVGSEFANLSHCLIAVLTQLVQILLCFGQDIDSVKGSLVIQVDSAIGGIFFQTARSASVVFRDGVLCRAIEWILRLGEVNSRVLGIGLDEKEVTRLNAELLSYFLGDG